MKVRGEWTRDKINKCAPAVAEKKGKKMTIVDEGDLSSYTVEGGKTLVLGWAGDLVVMTQQSLEGDKTFLSDVMKKTSSVKTNKPLSDLLGKTDPGGTMYGAFIPPAGSEAADSIGKATGGTEKLAGAFGTIKLASDLDINFGLRFASDAEAKSVADRMAK